MIVYISAVKSTDSSSFKFQYAALLIYINKFTIYSVRFTSFFHNLDLLLNKLQNPLPMCVLKSEAYELKIKLINFECKVTVALKKIASTQAEQLSHMDLSLLSNDVALS